MGKAVGFDTGLLHESEPVVGERGIFLGKDDVSSVLDLWCATTSDHCRDIFKFVPAAKIGAVADDAVIEEARAIRIPGFLESIDKVSEKTGGYNTGLGKSVVAEGMGLERDPHPGEKRANRLAVTHDIRHARLEGDDDHVIHQVNRLFTGDSFGGSLERSVGLGNIGPLGLPLEALLNLSDAGEVFIEFLAITFAKRTLHPSPIDANEIENTLLFLETGIEFIPRVAGMGEELPVEVERLVDAGHGIARLIPREGKPFPVAGV